MPLPGQGGLDVAANELRNRVPEPVQRIDAFTFGKFGNTHSTVLHSARQDHRLPSMKYTMSMTLAIG